MGCKRFRASFLLAKKERSWDEIDVYEGETPPCPKCGTPLVKKFIYSKIYCLDCRYGLNDNDASETLKVHDATQIRASNGRDEDYRFGCSSEELEAAL